MAKFSQIFLIAEITIGINLYWNRANRGVCAFRPNTAWDDLKYDGRRKYQHNEDDFLKKFLLSTSFLRITSSQPQVIKEKLY